MFLSPRRFFYNRSLVALASCLVVAICSGCASSGPVKRSSSDLVELSMIVGPETALPFPPKSRIVITDISSVSEQCAEAVKDALLRRLIDNTDYTVLSRDNLNQILLEADMNWGGRFNTETANKLGELLGASFHIVGRVAYCGTSTARAIDGTTTGRYTVLAALQVIDLQTGKVVVSSSSEGFYVPGPEPLFAATKVDPSVGTDGEVVGEAVQGQGKIRAVWEKVIQFVKGLFLGKKNRTEPAEYAIVKAADDLANSFANKFFSRSRWENVEMWANESWLYGDSVRLVKLGYCDEAISLLKDQASCELELMPEKNVAEYLQNYGVALLCANRPEEAVEKLRAAYRIDYQDSTLKMASIAWQLVEWSLSVEGNEQPEIEMLIDFPDSSERPRCTVPSTRLRPLGRDAIPINDLSHGAVSMSGRDTEESQ